MADVVVVGAGLAGLACAARLAKLGHSVVVCERRSTPGGLLRQVHQDGFTWDAAPMLVTLPAVLRDLFRKSGRPLERYVDLQLAVPARRHVFPDRSAVDLPTGSRAAQHDAISAVLGDRPAAQWSAFVDAQADLWERLRSQVLDVPQGNQRLRERKLAKDVLAGQSLERVLRKTVRDDRLRSMACYPALRAGRTPANAPAYLAVESYVERTFGIWHSPDGAADLSRALVERMSERNVEVRFDTEVRALASVGDHVTGVTLAAGGTLPAQVVVIARDGIHGEHTHVGLTRSLPHQPLEVGAARQPAGVGLHLGQGAVRPGWVDHPASRCRRGRRTRCDGVTWAGRAWIRGDQSRSR